MEYCISMSSLLSSASFLVSVLVQCTFKLFRGGYIVILIFFKITLISVASLINKMQLTS